MLPVPELRNPWIGDPSLHHPAGARPIYGQDRLPGDQHMYVSGRVSLQHIFNCGDPAQAYRSGGREEQNQAYVIRVVVEVARELIEVGGGKSGQRNSARPP